MKKLGMVLSVCGALALFFWFAGVIKDRQTLGQSLLRLHVVAASDSRQDQENKHLVKDAVVAYLQENMTQVEDLPQAVACLEAQIPQLQQLAKGTLEAAGSSQPVEIQLQEEAFPARDYETFSLPAGVYTALRIEIGEGQGQNWWCVAFPALCLPATAQGFEDTAAGAGFSDTLVNTLEEKPGYEIRFFFLDCLGWLENLFYSWF